MTDSTDDVDFYWPDEASGEVILTVKEARICLNAVQTPTSASICNKAARILQRALKEAERG